MNILHYIRFSVFSIVIFSCSPKNNISEKQRKVVGDIKRTIELKEENSKILINNLKGRKKSWKKIYSHPFCVIKNNKNEILYSFFIEEAIFEGGIYLHGLKECQTKL